ncbi:MAG: hypothetical protein DHS20C02_12950 [Micavibrio sp.]|nr:MAG: hypothetical protein DHS20C02_12950 [Micavibrio sp.]
MVIIETDNLEIEKELKTLEKLVVEGGGGVHSNVVMRSENGALSIQTKEPMKRGREIIRLSRDILLPTDQYDTSVKNNAFSVNFPENSTLSTLQKKLIECMITLYNLTDKVSIHKENSFLLSVADYPDLLKLLENGRVLGTNLEDWVQDVQQGLSDEKMGEFISETFFKTRHLGYSDYIRGGSAVSILMPIVDFLNHHWLGAIFNTGQGVRQGDLCVNNSQPIENNLECHAFYSVMDSFDALVKYDFIDEFSPIIRSVPIDLDVPDIGTIKINARAGAVCKQKLGKKIIDLNRFMPVMALDKQKKALTASHLIIPIDGSPKALRRILYIFLANMIGNKADEDLYKPWVEEAESQILEKNSQYYKDVQAMVEKLTTEKGSTAGLERIAHLAKLQLKKLAQYKYPD